MKQFGKIFKFEFLGHLKNKAFIVVTILLMVAIAAATFLPSILSLFSQKGGESNEGSDTRPTMAIYAEDAALGSTVQKHFANAFPSYRVELTEGGDEEIQKMIIANVASCGFFISSPSSYTYYVNNLSLYDGNTEVANRVLQEVYRTNAMVNGGLTPEEANQILSMQITGTTETLGKNQAQNFFYTYIMIFALYIVILLYGQMVASNVATEKSSCAMEVLITSANPTSMMFGKVLASCLAGFLQLFLVFGTAILFYNINKASLGSNPLIASIFNIPVELFLYMIVFFILGFLIYAFLFGAIGSTATKLEDINTSITPLMFLFVIAFMVVIFSMSSGSVDNTAMQICSFVPFTSPMAMFTRICMSSVPWYEILASIVILIASTVGTGFLSAKIYRMGVLLYGKQLNFVEIIKSTFHLK